MAAVTTEDVDDAVRLPGWRALSREALLAELVRRAVRAWEHIGAAEEAGDRSRLLRALERFYYRIAQLEHVRETPPDEFCQLCEPERAWREHVLRANWCLAHRAPVLEERARRWMRETLEGTRWQGGEE
jgi:hypothetical protein